MGGLLLLSPVCWRLFLCENMIILVVYIVKHDEPLRKAKWQSTNKLFANRVKT
jgi:hypothetical protein